VVEGIVDPVLKHPAWGGGGLEGLLRAEVICVSSVTIQKILKGRGLGSRWERWHALEQRYASEGMELSAEAAGLY